MAEIQNQQEPSFIAAIECVPPSPRSERREQNTASQFDPVYSNFNYDNSPFSETSELSYTDQDPLYATLQPDNQYKYDPATFDGPHQPQPLLFSEDKYYRESITEKRDFASSIHRSTSSLAGSSKQQTDSLGLDLEAMTFKSPLPRRRLSLEKEQSKPEIDTPSENRPQLHIVPATPISGGAADPFHPSIAHGDSLSSNRSWESSKHQQRLDDLLIREETSTPGSSSSLFNGEQEGRSRRSHRLSSATQIEDSSAYLLPGGQRTRSKSDTSLDSPSWESGFMARALRENSPLRGDRSVHGLRERVQDAPATVNMHDVLPSLEGHTDRFGVKQQTTDSMTLSSPDKDLASEEVKPDISDKDARVSQDTPGNLQDEEQATSSNVHDFRSPFTEGPGSLRRSKSDSGKNHRLSRSEDIHSPTSRNNDTLMSPLSLLREEFMRNPDSALTSNGMLADSDIKPSDGALSPTRGRLRHGHSLSHSMTVGQSPYSQGATFSGEAGFLTVPGAQILSQQQNIAPSLDASMEGRQVAFQSQQMMQMHQRQQQQQQQQQMATRQHSPQPGSMMGQQMGHGPHTPPMSHSMSQSLLQQADASPNLIPLSLNPMSHLNQPYHSAQGMQHNLHQGLPSLNSSNTLSPSLAAGRTHIRRASSGSRSDRGAEVWGSGPIGIPGNMDLNLNGGMGNHSMGMNNFGMNGHGGSRISHNSPRTARVIPYPSPRPSPGRVYSDLPGGEMHVDPRFGNLSSFENRGPPSRPGYDDLYGSQGPQGGLNDMHNRIPQGYDGHEPPFGPYDLYEGHPSGTNSRQSFNNLQPFESQNENGYDPQARFHHHQSTYDNQSQPFAGDDQLGIISKPTVTTGRTANASIKRRKQEAAFACPVPGCGSTFTRSFNLKGHVRSHRDEKPFLCHWPGCGKGFARQHDCKRHEQLHTNHRPFSCDGCHKTFARMDALNRHLRSDGGAECLRMQEANGGPGFENEENRTKLEAHWDEGRAGVSL